MKILIYPHPPKRKVDDVEVPMYVEVDTCIIKWSALVSIYQTDVTSFSQLSIKYKNFENELNPDPNPEPNPKPNPEPNPNQIEGKSHL